MASDITDEELQDMIDNLTRLDGEGIRSASHNDKQTVFVSPAERRAARDIMESQLEGGNRSTTAMRVSYGGWGD